ncbi:MAG: chaperone DnaJ domain protein [Chloroflexi bacterium]|jgi:curved DNA-binding protein|nr:chaperone DnaJ domain protein [Chloroflexota bacterium]
MEFRDYYAVLGVPKTASSKEIRSAYRKLARQHHPDVNPGNKEAEERFKEISEAYEVLYDPEKRKLYDTLGPQWREYERYREAGGTASPSEFAQATTAGAGAGAGAGRGGQGFDPFAGARRSTRGAASPDDLHDIFGQESPYSDFFSSIFGDVQGTTRRARRGGDVEAQVELSLEDAFRGTTVQLQITDPTGTPRTIEARIPPGVRDGSRIRLAGQGAAGRGGAAAGDLFVVVSVRPHPRFRREGDDLRTDASVDMFTCLLGGVIRVPTLKGTRLEVRIPPDTQNGQAIRLKGQGMPHLRHPERAGDLYVEVRVVLPTGLNAEERELVAELADRYEHHGEKGGAR